MSDSSGRLDRRQKLSQNQVESLIKAMESVDRRSPSQTNSEPLDAHDPIGSRAEPPEIDADLLSAVRWLHQSMARELKETLATILRTPVEVNVADVSTIFLDSFEEQAKDHRWRSVLSPEVSGGDWYFDVAPELCCVMVDRMLGGDPTEGETFTRPMTEIECRLMGRVVDGMLDIFQRAWQQVTDIRWLIRHQQTSPTVNTTQREAMVQIRFGIALCSNQENIRLCIPVRAIEDLRELLCDHSQRLDSASVLRPRQRMASNVAALPLMSSPPWHGPRSALAIYWI